MSRGNNESWSVISPAISTPKPEAEILFQLRQTPISVYNEKCLTLSRSSEVHQCLQNAESNKPLTQTPCQESLAESELTFNWKSRLSSFKISAIQSKISFSHARHHHSNNIPTWGQPRFLWAFQDQSCCSKVPWNWSAGSAGPSAASPGGSAAAQSAAGSSQPGHAWFPLLHLHFQQGRQFPKP